MERRMLGKTGASVTILGFGGFHMLEISQVEAARMAHYYLDAGGNYIETAASYGNGESEQKLGQVVGVRRQECFLVTKIGARDREGAEKLLERSLKNLRTDHVDLVLAHGVQSLAEFEQANSVDGALRALEAARQAGKVRFIGLSGHGQPDGLIAAIQRYPFDAVMTGVNYYDHFNFAETEGRLLPLALERGMGSIGMKAIADGYLYRSPCQALRYAWSLPIHTMVAGVNSMEMLKDDLRWAEEFRPMDEAEKDELFHSAIELGSYVCRQCDKCLAYGRGLNIPRLFMLEGWFDRQMWDGVVRDAADYALRNRLRFWFGQRERAQALYALEPIKPDLRSDYAEAQALYALEPIKPDLRSDYAEAQAHCPYGLPIAQKLRIAHYKLSGGADLF
jgi:predicted aldo/keto reductase-like oxidoreductase